MPVCVGSETLGLKQTLLEELVIISKFHWKTTSCPGDFPNFTLRKWAHSPNSPQKYI